MPGRAFRKEAPQSAVSPIAALVYFPVLIFAWGGNYTWMKLVVGQAGPWTFNALRLTGSAVLVGCVIAAGKGARSLAPVKGERASLALIGILQIGLLAALILLALRWIEASRTVLIIYTNPIWTSLFALVLLGERITAPRLLGLCLGLAGLLALTNPWTMDWNAMTWPGIALALAGTIAWAFASVLYRKRRWHTGLPQQLFWQLAASAALAAVCVPFLEPDLPIAATPEYVWILLWNVVGPTALAYWCWSKVLIAMSPATASQVLLLSPLYGVLQSHIVLGEPLSAGLMVAAACIVTGALLTFWRPSRG